MGKGALFLYTPNTQQQRWDWTGLTMIKGKHNINKQNKRTNKQKRLQGQDTSLRIRTRRRRRRSRRLVRWAMDCIAGAVASLVFKGNDFEWRGRGWARCYYGSYGYGGKRGGHDDEDDDEQSNMWQHLHNLQKGNTPTCHQVECARARVSGSLRVAPVVASSWQRFNDVKRTTCIAMNSQGNKGKEIAEEKEGCNVMMMTGGGVVVA